MFSIPAASSSVRLSTAPVRLSVSFSASKYNTIWSCGRWGSTRCRDYDPQIRNLNSWIKNRDRIEKKKVRSRLTHDPYIDGDAYSHVCD